MGRLSSKLRNVGSSLGVKGIMHWCPGCDEAHVFWYERRDGSQHIWTWDGNVDAPTCSPSMRVFQTIQGQEFTLCHYFLKAGVIEFLSDSGAHALRGAHPLPDWPYAEGEYGDA